MATCSKIFTALVISRIRTAYETIISNSQFGFRCNRSTTDAIFILQRSINISSAPLFICFIDLKAAYDWINRDMLFKILEIRLKSPVLVNILRVFIMVHQPPSKDPKYFLKHLLDVDKEVLSPLFYSIYFWILFLE